MVWRRCAALRPVVDDEVSRQRLSHIEKSSELSSDLLGYVLPVNDRHVTVNNGVGIAVNREVLIEFDAFLFWRHVPLAKEAWTPLNRSPIHSRGGADDPMWDVTNVNIEPVDSNRSSLSAGEAFRSGSQQ